jgi:predicted ATPase
LSGAPISRRIDKPTPNRKDTTMTDPLSLEQLDRRIAIVRDNIRQLIEQAAARSGAADEALASDRIAQQSEELERLTKERDALLAAQGKA